MGMQRAQKHRYMEVTVGAGIKFIENKMEARKTKKNYLLILS